MRVAKAAMVSMVVVLAGCGGAEPTSLCVPRAVTPADQYCISANAAPNGYTATLDVVCGSGDLFLGGGCAPSQKAGDIDVLLTTDRPVTDDTGHPVGWRCAWFSSSAMQPYMSSVLEAHVCCQKPVTECLKQE